MSLYRVTDIANHLNETLFTREKLLRLLSVYRSIGVLGADSVLTFVDEHGSGNLVLTTKEIPINDANVLHIHKLTGAEELHHTYSNQVINGTIELSAEQWLGVYFSLKTILTDDIGIWINVEGDQRDKEDTQEGSKLLNPAIASALETITYHANIEGLVKFVYHKHLDRDEITNE